MQAAIGIIGGTGLYELDFTEIGRFYEETPWGFPSSEIKICRISNNQNVAFLARHGKGHVLSPTKVNYRANIAAFKKLGVSVIIAFSAVGSLREEIKPCDFVLPTQLIDLTKTRESTFFDRGIVAHVAFADPISLEIQQLIADVSINRSSELIANVSFPEHSEVSVHSGEKTLVVIEGPAFSTRAESRLYRSWGCDIIGMTALPEAKLAREAEIEYGLVCMATDYDAWRHDEQHVDVDMVLGFLKRNGQNAKHLLLALLPVLSLKIDTFTALKGSTRAACVTDPSMQDKQQVSRLAYLFPGYFS